MAEEESEEGQEEAKPKSKLKLILIIVGALIFLGGVGGGAYWYFMMGDEESTEVVEGEEGEEDAEFDEDRSAAIYHKIRPTFITTFSANNRQRYMQVEVTLVTRSESVVGAMVTHQPLINNALVLLFADADYLELQTPEGKENLRMAAFKAVDEILKRESGAQEDEDAPAGLEKVLFTQFVMQ